MFPSHDSRLTAFRGFRAPRQIQDLPEFLVTGKSLLPLFPGLFHDSHKPAGIIPGKTVNTNDIGLGDTFGVQNKPSVKKICPSEALAKVAYCVIPGKAGVQLFENDLDLRFHRGDEP